MESTTAKTKKVRSDFLLQPDINLVLAKTSEQLGTTKTAIVERALLDFFEKAAKIQNNPMQPSLFDNKLNTK